MDTQTLKRYLQIATTEPGYVLSQINPIIRFWLNKLLNNYSNGYSFALNKVFLVLTFKCNLSCKMCVLQGDMGLCKNYPGMKEDKNLSLLKWQKIIDGFYKYSPSIIFFGGEPLLYSGWYEIAKYAKSKGLRLNLPTNGTLVENNAEKLLEVMDNIDFSIDGTEAIHDSIRGVAGTFKKVISGIKCLQELKIKRGQKKPYINICFTISQANYNNLVDFVEFLVSENLEINLLNFQHIEFTSQKIVEEQKDFFNKNFNRETNFWEGVASNFQNIDTNILISQMETLKNKKYKNINYIEFEPDFTSLEIKNYYAREDFKKDFKKCLAPYYEAMILPQGEMWICPDYSIGNAKDNTLYNLWNSEKARKFRNVLTKNKSLPICGNCYTVYLYK